MKRFLLLFAFVGCKRCNETAVDLPEASVSSGVVYDCAGFGPAPPRDCSSREPSDDLVDFAERLPEIEASHFPPDPAYWTRAEAALAAAESASTASLEERVLVQNAALHLSLAAGSPAPTLAARAKALVKKLAFKERPPAEPVGLEAWLGPASEWHERSVTTSPLFHEAIFLHTRTLRLIHTPSIRANFAQLVAVDDGGKPFVTGVVASIEIRRGFATDSPACVVLASPARVRCKSAGGLEAVASPDRFPQTHFLAHDETRVRCNGCHPGPSSDVVMGLRLIDVSPADVAGTLDARRIAVLRKLEADL